MTNIYQVHVEHEYVEDIEAESLDVAMARIQQKWKWAELIEIRYTTEDDNWTRTLRMEHKSGRCLVHPKERFDPAGCCTECERDGYDLEDN